MDTDRIERWATLLVVAFLFGGWIPAIDITGIYLGVPIPMIPTIATTQAILATLVVYVFYFEPA